MHNDAYAYMHTQARSCLHVYARMGAIMPHAYMYTLAQSCPFINEHIEAIMLTRICTHMCYHAHACTHIYTRSCPHVYAHIYAVMPKPVCTHIGTIMTTHICTWTQARSCLNMNVWSDKHDHDYTCMDVRIGVIMPSRECVCMCT